MSEDKGKEPAAPKRPGAFMRWLTGPDFKIIPTKFEKLHRASSKNLDAPKEEFEDYLGTIKRLVLHPVDVDDQYGLTHDELVPLPFDAPKIFAYFVEILSGIYLVAQACIVMFLAINVENTDRGWKSGFGYQKNWLPIVKALVILYPLATLLWLVTLTTEYSIRKFFYYRLLSMRILVDWHNTKIWEGFFFYYFMFTWALLNVWAIYGVAAYYNKNGNKGVDPTSFGTFVIVNLQTVQLIIYYNRLLATESRLVSLNQLFERAPVEAQRLLSYTYVIEEQDLIDHLYKFAVHTERALFKRLGFMMTCGLACKDWHHSRELAKINIEELKRCAPNYDEVEEEVEELRREEMALAAEGKPSAVNTPAAAITPTAAAAKKKSGKDGEGSDTDSSDAAAAAGGNDKKKSMVTVATAAAAAAGGTDAAPEVKPDQVTLTVDGVSQPRAAADDDAAMPKPLFAFWIFNPLRFWYQRMYASYHAFFVTVLPSFQTWPYRPDVPFLRTLTFVEMVGFLCVGAIVVLGILVSAKETSCAKAGKACNTCYLTHSRYFDSNEPACSALEASVTQIVGSTVGNWTNPATDTSELRYTEFQCMGNFTV